MEIDCRRALDLDPESPSAHYNMAVCLHTRFLTVGAVSDHSLVANRSVNGVRSYNG